MGVRRTSAIVPTVTGKYPVAGLSQMATAPSSILLNFELEHAVTRDWTSLQLHALLLVLQQSPGSTPGLSQCKGLDWPVPRLRNLEMPNALTDMQRVILANAAAHPHRRIFPTPSTQTCASSTTLSQLESR